MRVQTFFSCKHLLTGQDYAKLLILYAMICSLFSLSGVSLTASNHLGRFRKCQSKHSIIARLRNGNSVLGFPTVHPCIFLVVCPAEASSNCDSGDLIFFSFDCYP